MCVCLNVLINVTVCQFKTNNRPEAFTNFTCMIRLYVILLADARSENAGLHQSQHKNINTRTSSSLVQIYPYNQFGENQLLSFPD